MPYRTVPPIHHSHLCLWHLCNDLTRHVITHSSEIGGFRGAGQKVEHAKCCMHPMHISSKRLSLVCTQLPRLQLQLQQQLRQARNACQNSKFHNLQCLLTHTSQPHWSEELTKTPISLINNLKFSCFFSCSNLFAKCKNLYKLEINICKVHKTWGRKCFQRIHYFSSFYAES